jgi:hypothetical protein
MSDEIKVEMQAHLHWRAKRDPKAKMLYLQSFLREGRVVGPCWETLKPQGPEGLPGISKSTSIFPSKLVYFARELKPYLNIYVLYVFRYVCVCTICVDLHLKSVLSTSKWSLKGRKPAWSTAFAVANKQVCSAQQSIDFPQNPECHLASSP